MSVQHTRLLLYLTEVGRCGSIRAAAERLGIASSSINRQILALEQELGAALFERLPRGVRLTAAGEYFTRHARDTLDDLDRVRSLIEDLRGVRRGRVRIVAVEALAGRLLPEVIADFVPAHPGVQIDVSVAGTDEVVATVLSDDAELGIAFNPSAEREFQHIVSVPQTLYAIMRREHLLATKTRLRLDDCMAFPIALAKPTLGGRSLLQNYLDYARIRLSPAIESNSFELMKAFVARTDGICFQIGAGIDFEQGFRLVAVPLSDPPLMKGQLVFGSRRDRSLPVAATVFAEQIKIALRTLLAMPL